VIYGLCRNWRLTAPWSGSKIIVPAKFILSKNDVGLQSFGTEKYVKSGGLKENVQILRFQSLRDTISSSKNRPRE